jgi:RimJ/RimL family protein N-acetyltransferase
MIGNHHFPPYHPTFHTLKSKILNNYSIKEIKEKVIFHENNIINNKERMFDPSTNTFIPLKYFQLADGTVAISTISEYMDIARSFHTLFSKNLFSEKAFQYLFDTISRKVKAFDLKLYTANQEQEKFLWIFGLGEKSNVACSKIQDTTIQLKFNAPYKNITKSYKHLQKDRVYYGTLIGEIVSIAGCNHAVEPLNPPSVVDIGLETHESYRQRGYALSNVAALTDFLVDNGHSVKYCCNNKNIISIKTALSSGFQVVGFEKVIWCVNID